MKAEGPGTARASSSTAPALAPITRRALWLYGICRFISVDLTRVYLPGTVLGAQHLPKEGPYILAPVHRSNLDWLVVARITHRRLRYLVKDEVWKLKALGRFLELLGAFPVHRDSADREAFNRALEVLVAGEPLVMFPEGTRGTGPIVGELRDGAAYLALRAGVPIIPVGLAGSEKAMPRGAHFPRPSRVVAVVGRPIEVEAQAKDGARTRVRRSASHQLTLALHDAMQQALSEAQALVTRPRGEQALGFGAESGPPEEIEGDRLT